ncbi:MAG: PEGA domain-containing protein [Phycisphaerae bacterium]|nr:PEGA domain-containing protein [Phycisphaerae bacterium]
MTAIGRKRSVYVPLLLCSLMWTAPTRAAVVGSYGSSYLEDVDGLLVLHLKGTPTEMGQAHGRLLAEKIRDVYEALDAVLGSEISRTKQAEVAAAAKSHIPDSYVQEIQAIAAGANAALGTTAINANRLLVLHSWEEILRDNPERGIGARFAAMGSATVGGHVLMGLNYDDEECVHQGLQDGAVVIVYEPSQGYTFCSVGWAGLAGAITGINSQGVAISGMRSPTNAQATAGMPLIFQIRALLESAANVGAVESLLQSTARTVSGSLLVADGLGTSALRAFEFTPTRLEVFRENDANENHTYLIREEGVRIGLLVFVPPFPMDFPLGTGDINAVISKAVPNAIVRSNLFAHYKGTPGTATGPLLELQSDWIMNNIATNPRYEYIDISDLLPPTYPYRSLDILYLADKFSAKTPSMIANQGLIDFLTALMPGWDELFYLPEYANHSRYVRLRDGVTSYSGSIDADRAIRLLGGRTASEPFNVLTEPNSLHSVVYSADTLDLYVASAAPSGSSGKPDANLQTYRRFDFAAHATYPLTVRTQPVKGNVIVDGVDWGQAPQTRRVTAGKHKVSFGKVTGYAKPAATTVNVGLTGAELTGTYVLNEHRLNLTVDGQGAVTPPNDAYANESVLTIKATPDEGWAFSNWSGDLTGAGASRRVTITSDLTATAHFVELAPGQQALTIHAEGAGSVDPVGGVYDQGDVVTLAAKAVAGWRFLRWQGDAKGTSPVTSVTLTKSKLVTAVFEQITPKLKVNVVGDGTVSPDSGTYPWGQVLIITATPDEGSQFVRWEGDVERTEPVIAVALYDDMNLTAVFEPIPRTLTVDVQGQGEVVLDPIGPTYPNGATVTLTAKPASVVHNRVNVTLEPWWFIQWQGDVESSDNPMTITMDADKSLVAVFSTTPPGQDDNPGKPLPGDDDPATANPTPCFAAPAAMAIGMISFAGLLCRPRRRSCR